VFSKALLPPVLPRPNPLVFKSNMFGSGRGGPEALRMVEGVKNLKEDRRRARQAVAQVICSFLCLAFFFFFVKPELVSCFVRDCSSSRRNSLASTF